MLCYFRFKKIGGALILTRQMLLMSLRSKHW